MKSTVMKSPCKGCDDRHIGCHGSCGAYLSWAAGRKEINSRMSADRKINRDIEDLNYRSIKNALSGNYKRRTKK